MNPTPQGVPQEVREAIVQTVGTARPGDRMLVEQLCAALAPFFTPAPAPSPEWEARVEACAHQLMRIIGRPLSDHELCNSIRSVLREALPTDELTALRVENARLKEEVENQAHQLDEYENITAHLRTVLDKQKDV